MILLIRGGSIASGYGVDKSYVDILTEALRPGGIKIINRSKYRETTFDGIELFDKEMVKYKPDVVLIHFGVDDAFQCVYRSEFQENLVQMIRLAAGCSIPLSSWPHPTRLIIPTI